MNPKKTLILTKLTQEQQLAVPEEMNVIYCDEKTLSKELIADADVIVGKPPIELLPYAKKLAWLQLETAGNEQYAKEGLLPEQCILTNATGSFGLAISEYLLCTILMQMRNMNLYIRNQEQGVWQVEGPIQSIYGSTFLIVGLGDLGYEFAKKVKALGGYTIGIKKHVDQPIPYMDEVTTMDHLESLLPKADVVVLALPSTKETRGCFKRAYFSYMKPTAILANVGRGDVMDCMDVVDAIQHHELAGAILDVCNVEPIPKEHPIWNQKEIIVTPHISGTFQLPETKQRFVNLLVSNMKAYINEEPLRNVVDIKEGYRIYQKG